MKIRSFRSIPPVGSNIPFPTIIRVIHGRGNSSPESLNHIKDYLNVRYLLYISSGRAALWVILKVLSKMKPYKKEVIIPAYTCPAVASAVLKVGLKPVLSDINLADFSYSKENLERKLNKNTLAVIIVHLFGYPASMEGIVEWGKNGDFFVIEDAAQAFGNSPLNSDGRKLGVLGDAGFFSFGRGKPIGVLHGGLLTTQSDEIYQTASQYYNEMNCSSRLQDLKYILLLTSYSFFLNPHLYWIPQRVPFLNLGETIFEPDFPTFKGINPAAEIIGKMLDCFEEEKEMRKQNAHWYASNLVEVSETENPPASAYPYLRYPFILKSRDLRDRMLEKLALHGTGATLFYPCPLNELPGLKEVLQDMNIYSNAKKLSDTLITLPVHSGVTPSDRKKILTLIKRELIA